jgi:three-Cys-motif partner protein
MPTHEFGGDWTSEKLERVRKYLAAYTTIFAKNPRAQKLTTIYVDAFAGTGYRTATRQQIGPLLFPEQIEPDAQAFLKGSARIALEVEPPFKRYLFIERKPRRAQELEKLKSEFPTKANDIVIESAEANEFLQRWCAQTDWRFCRAVVFLDPYGMQVEWSLIEAIAKTRAIDLWILFPLGVAINRLLTKGELPPVEWSQSLTRILGTDEWRKAFYSQQVTQTLFGEEEVQVKDADFDRIGQFFVERLKTVFTAVADNPLPLRNSRNVPLYLLCFASGNPKGAPTAIKIAKHILRK